jgi:hypothetical protein
LLLQYFDLTILDNPGNQNVVAYFFLSRLTNPTNEGMVDDQFLDEHLLQFQYNPLVSDIDNFLKKGGFLNIFHIGKDARLLEKVQHILGL